MKTFLYNHRGDRDFKQLGDGCTVLHRRGASTGPACEPENLRLGREDHREERTRDRAPLDWTMSTGIIAAGVACLWGPAHGGANEAAPTVENIPKFIARAANACFVREGRALRPAA
jgi:hypothetical protein